MKTRPLPNDLRAAQQDIDDWRQRNGRRRLIPEAFWQRAAVLARIHGVNRVAVAMRLNRARVAAVEPQQQGLTPVSAPQQQKREVHFVELSRSMTTPPGGASGGLALELADGSSRRMHVTGADARCAVNILAAFFGEEVGR